MFIQFFQALKSAKIPVSVREYLTLMQALEADLAGRSVEDFYYLSRAALVKDERFLDRFGERDVDDNQLRAIQTVLIIDLFDDNGANGCSNLLILRGQIESRQLQLAQHVGKGRRNH